MTRFDVRTPPGLPQGVPPPAFSWTPVSVTLAAVTLALSLLGMYGGAAMWVANTNTAHDSALAAVRAAQADLAATIQRLDAATTERLARLDSQTNARFDAYDKRGDSRLNQLNARFEKSERNDEAFAESLNGVQVRLARIDALLPLMAANPAAGAKR